MIARSLSVWVVAALLAMYPGTHIPAHADDSPEKPKTHQVTTGAFEYAIHVDGTIESLGAEEIVITPGEWSSFTVESAITSGELVREGDELVRFDRRAFDRELDDLRYQVSAGKLAIHLAKIELEILSKTTPLDLEAAERSAQVAAEDWDYYQKLGEALDRQSTEENLKAVKDMLEGSEEELEQLEKMYKADDLTEETEEIILKRARREVERAQFTLKVSQSQHDRRLEMELPREKRQKEINRDREALSLAKAKVSLPLTLEQKKVELKKLEQAQIQLSEKLDRLQKDEAQLVLKSPIQGVVVYGQAERGKWTTSETMRGNLRKGGTILPNQVIMTVIPDAGAFVTIDIPEKDRSLCKVGQTGEFVATAYPDVSLPCQLAGFSRIFVKDGFFGGVVEITAAKDDPRQRPVFTGMTGKVRIVMFSEKAVIAVPVGTVFTDEENPNLRYCYVFQEGAEPRRQSVEVGMSTAIRTHIKSGLKVGDEILLTQPERK